MKFVCIVFELGDKMLTVPSMENLKVQKPKHQEFDDALPSLCHILDVYSPCRRKDKTMNSRCFADN